MILTQHSANSDWLFNAQLRVLQADWFILQINEKTILNINMQDYICECRGCSTSTPMRIKVDKP